MNPVTGGRSAPDVTVATADIAAALSWTTEKGMKSDHFLVTTTIPASSPRPQRRGKGRLALRKAHWKRYRTTFDRLAERWEDQPSILRETDPRHHYLVITIIRAARQTVPYDNSGKTRDPIWNEACKEVVKDRSEAGPRPPLPITPTRRRGAGLRGRAGTRRSSPPRRQDDFFS